MRFSDITKRIGLLRSIAMYYWKPMNKRRLRNFYGQFISPGDLCFDIGAHVGNRADAWESLGAQVIAVEPQEHCINYMRRRFRNKDKITVIPKAVGAAHGTATLHVSRMTPTISTLSDEDWRDQINEDAWYKVSWEDQVQVEVITLDHLIEQYGTPAFCKIDVENHELEVLQGLTHAIPALSFEYYPPYTGRATTCVRRIEALGPYQFNWSFGETQRLNSDEWLSADALSDILGSYATREHYGDVYARIC
jgi:FkbM family methyltransferase